MTEGPLKALMLLYCRSISRKRNLSRLERHRYRAGIKASVTGIGDDAYVTENGKVTFPISPSIAVKKGSVFFVIAAKITNASYEQTKAAEKAVALKILEKL
jgi:hypothetical protein